MPTGESVLQEPWGEAGPVDNTLLAYEQVRSAILSGTLEPGSWVSQVQLAAQLNISRTPLREALRLLQNEGLVQADFNRRVRVAPLSLPDLEALYAMRLAAEPLAVRLSVPELTADDLRARRAALDAMHSDDEPAVVAVNHRRFHLGLVVHAPDRLRRHVEDLWDHAERYRIIYQEDDRDRAALIAVAVTEHERILQAAERGDAALCARRVAEHLARAALAIVAKVDGSRAPRTIREALRHALEAAPSDA
jgi:DNA-binding GntR family transcriptional regulator